MFLTLVIVPLVYYLMDKVMMRLGRSQSADKHNAQQSI
jgi:hypothetical protein